MTLVRRDVALASMLAAAATTALLTIAPPGVDLAAHVYQRGFFLQHGFSFWNNFWYGGHYTFVGYSLLYYPLAALAGFVPLAVLAAAGTAGGFALLVLHTWGERGRLAIWAFAVFWPAVVLGAAFPFELGMAFAVLAAAALHAGRRTAFGTLAALTLLTSPLALIFLAVALTAMAFAGRLDRTRILVPLTILAVPLLAELAVTRAFPSAGRFPFPLADYAATMTFCALGLVSTRGVQNARALQAFFAVYTALATISFAVPSSLGSNVDRMRFAALPLALLVLSLRDWKPLKLALPVLALATCWNLTPAVAAVLRSSPDAESAYWAPAIGALQQRLSPSYRVEVVDTTDHWAAAYLPAAGISIVRGWFRQDDFPTNEALYDAADLNAPVYLHWLRSVGAAYVLLPDAAPDYSARAEARLIGSGHSGLRFVERTGHVRIYAVPDPWRIVRGPARAAITQMTATTLRLALGAPGRYHLAVRWSPYWHLDHGCTSRAPDGSMWLRTPRAGPVTLRFEIDVQRGLAALAGLPAPTCA